MKNSLVLLFSILFLAQGCSRPAGQQPGAPAASPVNGAAMPGPGEAQTSPLFTDSTVPSGVIPANPATTIPMLKCPAVPEAYSKMITSLKLLQTQIKSDTKGNCEPVKQEVISLQSLLDERRKAVVDLVNKSKTTPLTEAEMTTLRTYVSDVTTKVINTAELLDRSSNQCFAEDQKPFGFGDLASLTLDATALAKTVAGPWAEPIALGGQALAGIFQGLERVLKNNRGYDFSQLDQRESYVQSLCSYYNYRQDMNSLVFPTRRATELRQVEQSIRSNLTIMTSRCPQCEQLAQNFSHENSEDVTKQALATDRAYAQPLGSYTVQSLSAIEWVRAEEKRIAAETGDEFGIGRDLLSEKVASMDQFFFQKEAPDFLRNQGNKANDLYNQFSRYVMGEGSAILAAVPSSIDVSAGNRWGIRESEKLDFVTRLRSKLDPQSSLNYRIDDYERASIDLLDRTSLALQVEEGFCRFFQKAGYYNGDIQSACEQGQATQVRAKLEALANAPASTGSTPDSFTPSFLGLAAHIPPKPSDAAIGLDWADSLQLFVDRLSGEADLFAPAK